MMTLVGVFRLDNTESISLEAALIESEQRGCNEKKGRTRKRQRQKKRITNNTDFRHTCNEAKVFKN